jgi:hypothetical protein
MAKKAKQELPFAFRETALRGLTNQIGVYVLCDLDGTPIYVGKSEDGIRARVRRHLTSARSDIIANRQVDVWEVAYVWAFPVVSKNDLAELEARLFRYFDGQSPLFGAAPRGSIRSDEIPEPAEKVAVLKPDQIESRLAASLRLPRQAAFYASIVDHFVNVKQSKDIARALDAHFGRLEKYHAQLLKKEEKRY